MTRETLDETIDRVAGEMTAVPSDAAFVARLRAEFDRPQPRSGVWTACIAFAVLALAIAPVLFRSRGAVPSAMPAPAVASVPPVESRPAIAATMPAPSGTGRAMPGARVPARIDRAANGLATIPALPTPADLDLAHLELEPLDIAPADVSSLELPDISIAGLGSTGDPKE